MASRLQLRLVILLSIFYAIITIFMACSPADKGSKIAPITVQQPTQQAPFSPSLNEWPHSISDITPDSRVTFGRLANGLRYAILPIADDNGTVSIQMQISVGFKDEPKHLYGIAHILEHMAFRGTNKDKEKSIIHDMQTLGAGFGFDLNGFTSRDNTFYRVNLTSPKFDEISTALNSFSDLVMEPSLTAEYLDIERKVVFSELKQRDSIRARAKQAENEFKYPDRERNEAPGIGTKESLDAITLEDVEVFFREYYRPDNTILVVAGGVDLLKTEKKLKQVFSNWSTGSNTPRKHVKQFDNVDLTSFPRVKHFMEKGAKTQLNLIENTPATLQNDTLKIRKKIFAERIANAMIKTRLKPRIEAEKNVSWINFKKTRTKNYDIQSVTIGARDYVIASTFFEEERLRAVKHGFTEEELALALKAELAILKRLNEKPGFINAWSEANRLRRNFNSGQVHMSRAQQLALFQSFLKNLSLKDYNEAARNLWADFKPRYWTQSNNLMDETLKKIEVNLEKLSRTEISKPVSFAPDVFKDTDFGYGRIRHRDVHTKGKVHRLLFENGIRLNYLKRETEKDNVQIVVTLAGDFKEFAPRYASIVEQVSAFSRADIHGVTQSEMDRQFVGQKTSFIVRMSGKRLAIYASTRPEDLDASLSIITSFISDVDVKSKLRKQKFDKKIKNIKTASDKSPAVAGSLKIPYIYSGKANSFLSKTGGLYSSDAKTLASIKNIIDSGLIEVGVVGDFDPKVLEDLFSSSLGALPARRKIDESVDKLNDFTQIKPGVTNLTYGGPDSQMALFYCWPLASKNNTETEILENLSSQVINNRIIQRLREELGVTYSPNIVRQQNQAFPNLKYTCFSIQFSPEEETTVHENISNILDELPTTKITKTELKRAREPTVSLLERFGNSNQALAESVALAYSEPNLLNEFRETLPLLKKVRLQKLNRHISQNYLLVDAHIFRIQSPEPHTEMKRKALEIEANMGRAEAQYALGDLLKTRAEDGDSTRSLELFEKAAAQNHKQAHFALGRHYALSRKNLKVAANHLRIAEDQKEGTFLLAEMYFRNPDMFPDITDLKIIELYKLSAEKGYSYAQQALAQRYKDGAITERDYVKAYKWALLSRSSTTKLIKEKNSQFLNSFKKYLTEAEQELALEQAQDWFTGFNSNDY